MSGPVTAKAQERKVQSRAGLQPTEPLPAFAVPGGCTNILQLQRSAGNQAVQGLMEDGILSAARSSIDRGGQALEPMLRAEMEAGFGEDFSQVRVHTEGGAADSAKVLHAQAYTVGNDVVFGRGRYAPGESQGKRLLAHELAHVVQQSRGGPRPDLLGDAVLEGDASRAAASVVQGGSDVTVAGASGAGIAMEPDSATKAGRLDELYSAFLKSSVVPQSVKDKVKAANEMVAARLDSTDPTGGLRQEAKAAVTAGVGENRLKAVESILGTGPASQENPSTLPSASAATAAPPQKAGQPEGGAAPGLEAKAANEDSSVFHGIAEYFLVRSLPAARHSYARKIAAGPYTLQGFVTTDQSGTESVAYYLAVNREEHQVHWVVGPDAVERFIAEADARDTAGRFAYQAGPPHAYEAESVRVVNSIMSGEFGRGAKEWWEANSLASRDPKFLLQMMANFVPMPNVARIGRRWAPAIGGAFMKGAVEAVPVIGGEVAPKAAISMTERVIANEAAPVITQQAGATSGRSLTSVMAAEVAPTGAQSGVRGTAGSAAQVAAPVAGKGALPSIEGGLELAAQGTMREGASRVSPPTGQAAAPASAQEPGFHELDLGPAPAKVPDLYAGNKPLGQVPYGKKPKATFGEPSDFKSGTEYRGGAQLRTYDAAEISRARLRIEWDPQAGRPGTVTYEVHGDMQGAARQSERGFAKNPLEAGAQSSDAAYANSGMDRGHLAQREAFKGDPAAERAADQFTNVVPMAPELNRGAGSPWRAAETRTINLARTHGKVTVKVTPVYESVPRRLPDGTPIPVGITREVWASDGTLLEAASYLNR